VAVETATRRLNEVSVPPAPLWLRTAAPLLLALSAAIAAFSLHLTWVGFLHSDDQFYAGAASGWAQHVPYLGQHHWGIRHVIVLPMALLFRLFGASETTLLLPTLGYEVALLLLLAVMAWRLSGGLAAAVAVATAATVQALATGATMVSTDVPEAFFVVASLWTFHLGVHRPRAAMLALSGALGGLALITRETAVTLFLLYGVLFLFGYGGSRRAFLWLSLGAVCVVAADWLFLTSLSGDPLYRLHIALKGVHGDGPQMDTGVSDGSGLDRFGTLSVSRWLRPFAATFLNQSFGLFMWFAVPATVWMLFHSRGQVRQALLLIAALALAWFVVIGYVLMPWLWVIPRYYGVVAILAVPLGCACAAWVSQGRGLAVATGLALLIGTNLAVETAATSDLMAGEHALAAFAASTTAPVRTDPSTADGARWLLERRGVADRVTVGPPAPGALYFFNSRPRRSLPPGWAVTEPPSGWTEVAVFDVPRKWTAGLVHDLGLARVLPAGLVAKLDPPPHRIGVYRASG
jgi:4-amino-4-deoxy-L-arabinose transferase-like glycosyltransferase